MRVLFVCLFVVNHVVVQSAQEIKGEILAKELDKVADSVGWSFLQVHIYIAENSNNPSHCNQQEN